MSVPIFTLSPFGLLVFALVKRKDVAMEANPWRRLSDIAYARMAHLGLTQTDVEKVGGPSHGWIRRLKAGSGKPSSRHARSLRQLSLALGWDENTAWSLLTDDRSGWSKAVLADEEHELVYGPSVKVVTESEQVPRTTAAVRAFTRLFQSDDPIPGLSDEEWDELLEAVEKRWAQGHEEKRRASGD